METSPYPPVAALRPALSLIKMEISLQLVGLQRKLRYVCVLKLLEWFIAFVAYSQDL